MEKFAYTKGQILLGTFIGGPLAAIYFLKKNFDAMGDANQSQKTVKIGLILLVFLLVILPLLPEAIPSVAYSVAYAAATHTIYAHHQQTFLKNHPRFSHWNTAGVAIAAIIIFMSILFPLVYLYYELGILKD